MPRNAEVKLRDLLTPPPGMEAIDFTRPAGAAALCAADSVTWRVMKNPVALMVGGIAAVILELAEPRVRAGVWEHTRFRDDPAGRIRRTGFAALATVYAPTEKARALINRVNAMHARISGTTPEGIPYRANDPELLRWVYATAQFGFVEAYRRFVHKLTMAERDRFYAEGAPVAALWGVREAPASAAEVDALFQSMRNNLERSSIVFDFIGVLKRAPLLPALARPLQSLAVGAAVEITPAWARRLLGLGPRFGLPAGGEALLRALGAVTDHIAIDAPPAQACERVGLPRSFLYR